MNKNKFLITQTLLSSWNWIYKLEDGYEDFLKTLNKEAMQPNQAMLDGQQFENMVYAHCEGAVLDEAHKWAEGIKKVSEIVRNGAYQVKLSKPLIIDNIEFLLYGIFDVLKEGQIYDIKFSKTYSFGKYLDSPQHSMYFELCPEVNKFTYLISDGKELYKERYERYDTKPIELEIKQFMRFLEERNLVDTYCKKWQSKY